MYVIQATIEQKHDDWTHVRQVPTFYLDENVQGITSEGQAIAIARDVLGGTLLFSKGTTAHISATHV